VGEWRASERAVLANTGWRCSVFWFENGEWQRPVTVFSGYKTSEAVLAAARSEAGRLNAEGQQP
jgi:hypothetical protein